MRLNESTLTQITNLNNLNLVCQINAHKLHLESICELSRLDASFRQGCRRLPCRGICLLLGILQLLFEFRVGGLGIGADHSGIGVRYGCANQDSGKRVKGSGCGIAGGLRLGCSSARHASRLCVCLIWSGLNLASIHELFSEFTANSRRVATSRGVCFLICATPAWRGILGLGVGDDG